MHLRAGWLDVLRRVKVASAVIVDGLENRACLAELVKMLFHDVNIVAFRVQGADFHFCALFAIVAVLSLLVVIPASANRGDGALGTVYVSDQGLYFELRKDGKALDPAAWISR